MYERRGLVKRKDPVVKTSDEPQFHFATSAKHRELAKKYRDFNIQNKTPIYLQRLQEAKIKYHTEPQFRQKIIEKRKEYSRNHRKQENEKKRNWNRKIGNKRIHAKRGKWQNYAYKRSGYRHMMHYLNYRKMKPPLNFTIDYKRKKWAWTFAHP